MPAPDVQYFLDCSVESGHMGADTHFYFMEIADDANAVLDAYEGPGLYEPIMRRVNPNFTQHWHGLIDTGLYMEANFLKWRAVNRDGAREASLMGLRNFQHAITDQVRSAASLLAEKKHDRLTPAAMRLLDDRYGFSDTLGIIRRSLGRAVADLRGATQGDLDAIQQMSDRRHAANRAAYLASVERVRDDLMDQDVIHGRSTPAELKKARRAVQERASDNRRVIKRSVRFLNRLVGQETTRLFVGGKAIRFEGRLANYELTKTSTLLNAHGGWHALAVYDKDHPDLRLCNLCIATDKVPLLDHIASLVMHIQTGHEEDILNIGNAAMIVPEAYERPWLVPHLPDRNRDVGALGRLLWGMEQRDPVREVELEKLLTRFVYQEVMAPNMDVIRIGQEFNNRQMLAAGHAREMPLLDWTRCGDTEWVD